jgi:hypothetical protein
MAIYILPRPCSRMFTYPLSVISHTHQLLYILIHRLLVNEVFEFNKEEENTLTIVFPNNQRRFFGATNYLKFAGLELIVRPPTWWFIRLLRLRRSIKSFTQSSATPASKTCLKAKTLASKSTSKATWDAICRNRASSPCLRKLSSATLSREVRRSSHCLTYLRYTRAVLVSD